MRLKFAAATLAAATVLASLAVPAFAQVRDSRTVFTLADEDGRTHTRIIIQKRSFLDPGTETSPGESEHNYASGLTNLGPACSTTLCLATIKRRCRKISIWVRAVRF